MRSGPIERASSIDLMELAATTVPAAGQVGALLVLATAPFDLDALRSTLSRRVAGVPRLRQRLRPVPLGCGRPIWIDDPSFDIARHVSEVRCPPPGDRSALLATAALLLRPAPSPRAAIVVGDPRHRPRRRRRGRGPGVPSRDGRWHGRGGPRPPRRRRPHPQPRRLPTGGSEMARAACRRDACTCARRHPPRRRRPPVAPRRGPARHRLASGAGPRRSLNRPSGPRRCLAVARTDLDAVRARGAPAGSNGERRGACGHHRCPRTPPPRPARGRRRPRRLRSPSQAGELRPPLSSATRSASWPCGCRRAGRPRSACERSRPSPARGSRPRAAVRAAVLALVFRLLAATQTLRWCTDHQRRVTTFVTNLRDLPTPSPSSGRPSPSSSRSTARAAMCGWPSARSPTPDPVGHPGGRRLAGR